MVIVISDLREKYFYHQLCAHVGDVLGKEPHVITWAADTLNNFQAVARRFSDKRDEFQQGGKPIDVQIAYHYTDERKMRSISCEGLRASEAARGVFGRGIYVGNNPHAFRSYGEIGLVCLIIVGTQRMMYDSIESSVDASVDSFHGNKVTRSGRHSFVNATTYYNEIVLRDRSQVLPLFQFRRELSNNTGYLWEFHTELQNFVDVMFPSGWPVRREPVRPNYQDLEFEAKLAKANKFSIFLKSNCFTQVFATLTATGYLPVATVSTPLQPPERVDLGFEVCNPQFLKCEQQNIDTFCAVLSCPSQEKDECPICLSSLKPGTSAVSIKQCKHAFHRECLQQAVKVANKCPMCRISLGATGPTGKSPYGILLVTLLNNIHCGGFNSIPTLYLKYEIPRGIQSAEHENPGRHFSSTTRKAYLPANKDGYELVKRLRYAFRRGLTFMVGTSLSRGGSDSVIWASIHHKTVRSGGLHGWPDPAYFANVNAELDGLDVPKASRL